MISEFLNGIFPFFHGINDLTDNHYLYFSLIRKAWDKGQFLPTFNPYIFGGRTLIGDSFNSMYYPPNWLFGFLSLEIATVINLIFHLSFMAAGLYFLLRYLKINKNIAIITSLIFVLWPKWCFHIVAGHLGLIQCFSWLPVIFLFILKSLEKTFKATPISIVIFTIFLFLNFWSNIFFSFHFYAFFFLIYLLMFIFFRKNINMIEIIKFFGISIVIFLIVNAFQIIPMMQIAGNVNRSELLKTDILPLWSYKNIFLYSLFPYKNLLSIDQEQMLFVGIVFFLVCIFGIIKSKFTFKKIFIISFVIFVLITLNFKTPFFSLFQLLPGTSFIRVTSRFWIFAFFIMTIFFAYGLSKISSKKIIILIVFLIIAEYGAIDVLKLTSKNIYGDQKFSPIYPYLAKNFPSKKIYEAESILSQYFVAKYNLTLIAGSSAWQEKEYMKILKKAGGYPDFEGLATTYPPYQRIGAQPVAKYLCQLKGGIVISRYRLTDSAFKYVNTVDKIKVYENPCLKH
jgi:hypothetical protein